MDFDELTDGIGADDWLIPRHEITRRKMIRQTSRFKIYKADWFGDVLVYEPVVSSRPGLASRRQSACQGAQSGAAAGSACCARDTQQHAKPALDQEAFRLRLDQLCLDLQAIRAASGLSVARATPDEPQSPGPRPRLEQEPGQVDSAYSSISSTPQYHTKHSAGHHEFEFPSQQQQQQQTQVTPTQVSESTGGQQETSGAHKSTNCAPHSPPVVLNRDSFVFGHWAQRSGPSIETNSGNCGTTTTTTTTRAHQRAATTPLATADVGSGSSSAAWFELNELRLVAHENFMLFMGACLQGEQEEETRTFANENMEHNAALVMQMSHPRAVSLRDVLHATSEQQAAMACNGYSSTSPVNRFFSAARHRSARRQRHLTVEAKLNICQQVTNAMTYLHDKNIVHGRLTSVNIYLELNQRVKISLLDNDEQQIVLSASCAGPLSPLSSGAASQRAAGAWGERRRVGCRLNLSALTYLSPELVRSVRVTAVEAANGSGPDAPTSCDHDENQQQQQLQQQEPLVEVDARLITREADLFAFGTLLFELFEERFPFADESAPAQAAAPATPLTPLTPPSTRFLSPEVRRAANAKLFDTLCLESAGARSPRPGMDAAASFPAFFSPVTPAPQSAGVSRARANIKCTASELIYRIGSGQITERNPRRASPPLVDYIISACWAAQANARPSFKQLKFE